MVGTRDAAIAACSFPKPLQLFIFFRGEGYHLWCTRHPVTGGSQASRGLSHCTASTAVQYNTIIVGVRCVRGAFEAAYTGRTAVPRVWFALLAWVDSKTLTLSFYSARACCRVIRRIFFVFFSFSFCFVIRPNFGGTGEEHRRATFEWKIGVRAPLLFASVIGWVCSPISWHTVICYIGVG